MRIAGDEEGDEEMKGGGFNSALCFDHTGRKRRRRRRRGAKVQGGIE